MKKKLILFLWWVSVAFVAAGNEPDSLLNLLSESITHYQKYVKIRENRISFLKAHATCIDDSLSEEMYRNNMELYKEYKAYICDSAICYLNKNLCWAEQNQDIRKSNEIKLLLSHLLTSAGMYKESVDVLESVARSSIPESTIADYYSCCHKVYGELAYYTQDKKSGARYKRIARLYKDSLNLAPFTDSESYLEMKEEEFRDIGFWKDAMTINNYRLDRTPPGTPRYALVTYHRAMIYRGMEDQGMVKHFLKLSALTDIQLAIKDHASLWTLAQILYEEGDIERAHQFIRFSWSETNFYNAPSRSLQTAGVLSLIDLTYQAMREEQSDTLRYYFRLISALSFLLLIAMVYICWQMRKLSVARNHLQEANTRLKNLNDELREMNFRLQESNQELSESNQIKEEYIGRFIKLCSTYIDKLDDYRRVVNKKIISNQIADLQKMTRSRDMLDDGLKELYAHFDAAFLQLFPDFVEKFNGLLVDDKQIVLKKGDVLNTELRIFALIRLGITDSSQIAEFLHYSVNTIYNYRAKVKSKARISRDSFENQVLQIK